MRRRELLVGGAALALSPWARAQPGAPPLPAPDFGAERRRIVGVRPFRVGGVRLERDAPLGGKQILHNYGHAGAGITLAFGCAEALADLLPSAQTALGEEAPAVAVIGVGAIGLTTALAIQRRYPRTAVTLYARDLDVMNTTSAIAGGQFEPSGVWRQQLKGEPRARLESWLRRSRDRLVELEARWGELGIARRDNYTLAGGTGGFDRGTPRDVIPAPTELALPFEKLTAPGRLYKTWLLDPLRLLPALKGEVIDRGGKLVQWTFRTKADLAALPEPVVVNCTGWGAKALFDDDAMIAQRGHLVLLDRPSVRHDYLFGGGCGDGVVSYVFCRHDDIVVGGTVIGGDARATVVPEDQPTFDRLVTNAAAVFDGRPAACVR